MQYAANEAKKQALNDRYKKYNDQLITHGYSHAGDEQYIGKDLGSSGVPVAPSTPSGSGSSSGNGSSSGSGGKKSYGSLASLLGGLWGQTQQPGTTPPAEIVPDTTVEDSYKASMEAANDRLKQAYEYQQGLLSKAKDDALREAYIKQQMVERGYPEQLSAAGINGGAAQALLARNNADYAKQRGSIQGNYMNNLGEAGQAYQQGVLQNNQNFLESMAAYRQGLDEMRRKWELEQLEKSGLLKTTANGAGNGLGGLGNLFGVNTLTPQEYLNNLRTNYGSLFK